MSMYFVSLGISIIGKSKSFPSSIISFGINGKNVDVLIIKAAAPFMVSPCIKDF